MSDPPLPPPRRARPRPRGRAGGRRPAEMPSAGRDCALSRGFWVRWDIKQKASSTARTPRMETRATRPRRYHWPMPTGTVGLVAHARRISRHRPAPDYCNDHHTGPSHSIGPRAQHVMHIVHRAHCVHCVSGKGTQVLCTIAHIMPAIRVHIVLLCNRQGNASSLPYGSHVYPARERKFSCPYIVVYQPSSTSFVGVNGT